MKWVLVIESEDGTFREIRTILSSIDENLKAVQLKTVKDITKWFETVFLKRNQKKSASDVKYLADVLSKDEDDIGDFPTEVPMVISDHRIVGPKQVSLLEKLSKYFKSQNLLGGRERLGVVFIAREVEEFNVKPFLNTFFDNIIYKPFDRLVCKERLKWAMLGSEALKNEELYKEKPATPIEMLKDLDVVQRSEIGFQTIGNSKDRVGSVSKYYGDVFGTDVMNGVFARCIDSRQNPQNSEQYISSFTYFGIGSQNIKTIKSGIAESNSKGHAELLDKDIGATVGLIIVSEDPEMSRRAKETLQAHYMNASVVTYENLVDFILDLDPNSAAEEYKNINYDTDKIADEIRLVYDSKGEVLIETEPKISGRETLLGFNYDELSRFKTLCMSEVDPTQRQKVQKYWMHHVQSRFTLSVRNTKQREVVTLLESTMESQNGRPRLVIKFRRAFHEEVVDYMKDKSALPKVVHGIFFSNRIANLRDQGYWVGLRQKLVPFVRDPSHVNAIPFFVIGTSPIMLHEQVDELAAFTDYFQDPLDVRYFNKKCKMYLPNLFGKENPIKVDFESGNYFAQRGMPIEVELVSEASLSVKGKKPFRPGEFRKFLLYSPKQNERPELLAKSVDSEKESGGSGAFINHFTFFGMDDGINRFIRQWLLEQYQLTKEDQENS